MEKQKRPTSTFGRLWAFWKRNSLRVYAIGTVYLVLMVLFGYLTAPMFTTEPKTAVGYLVLSNDEIAVLTISTFIMGGVLLLAVIGYAAHTHRWLRVVALVVFGFLVWLAGSAYAISFAFTPSVARVPYNGQVYQLAYVVFGSIRSGSCAAGDGICGGFEYQLYECNGLALACQAKGEPFRATTPRLEIVDGVLNVARYNGYGRLVDVVMEVSS
jgi:hypothetical protein